MWLSIHHKCVVTCVTSVNPSNKQMTGWGREFISPIIKGPLRYTFKEDIMSPLVMRCVIYS